jgi:hypothetical protein
VKSPKRHLIITALFVLGFIVFWAMHTGAKTALAQPQYFTGWMLLAVMIAVAALNIRKKIVAPPLGAMHRWLSFHVYAGLFTIVAFLVHIDLAVPTGILEWLLAIFYTLIALSGIVGLIISRTFAKRLSTRGEEVIYEQIPFIIKGIRDEAEKLAEDSIASTEATTIAEYFTERLHDFFYAPRNAIAHVFESRRPLQRLQIEMNEQKRYMNAGEIEIWDQMIELVEIKDSMDYHYALQRTLKGWLFLHIPITYGLLVLVLLHILLVYTYTGGFR